MAYGHLSTIDAHNPPCHMALHLRPVTGGPQSGLARRLLEMVLPADQPP